MKQKITVDRKRTHDTVLPFEGFGTSLCWWAHRIGYSDELSEKAAKLFFSPDGLNMSVMRYNIGGGDDPTHHHIKRTDSDVPGWIDIDGNFNPEADKNQLNVLLRAYKAAGEDARVETFSNSPPYFMTISGCSSGSHDAKSDNIKPECYDMFTQYCVDVTKYIQNELNVRVTSLDVMNEPDTDFWFENSPKQEGCHVSPGAIQSELITLTAKKLHEAGLDNVLVSASDETSTHTALTSYKAYTDEAKRALGRLNAHTYSTLNADALGDYAEENRIPFWMSEVDGAEMVCYGKMGCPLWLAIKVIHDMNSLRPSAWTLWQVIDTHISENGRIGNRDSGMPDINRGYWGLATADHDRGEIILTKKYYALGNFSRYIRPGMKIISTGNNSIAAYDEKTRKLVIVAVNVYGEEYETEFDISSYIFGNAKVTRVVTDADDDWKESVALAHNGMLTDSLRPESVTTYIISEF